MVYLLWLIYHGLLHFVDFSAILPMDGLVFCCLFVYFLMCLFVVCFSLQIGSGGLFKFGKCILVTGLGLGSRNSCTFKEWVAYNNNNDNNNDDNNNNNSLKNKCS